MIHLALSHSLFSRLLRSVREEQFLYLWKVHFYTDVIFCPESWALTLLLFKWTGYLPLLMTEAFVSECLEKKISQFSFVVLACTFHSLLGTVALLFVCSIILRVKFSFCCYFFLRLEQLLFCLHLVCLSLFMELVKCCRSEMLQERMKKIKMDKRSNSRETYPAVEQSDYPWKFCTKCEFLGTFRNKNGIEITWTLL